MLFVRKRCLKCGGNLYLDSDFHGSYEQCLQCATVNDATDANGVKNTTIRIKTASQLRITDN